MPPAIAVASQSSLCSAHDAHRERLRSTNWHGRSGKNEEEKFTCIFVPLCALGRMTLSVCIYTSELAVNAADSHIPGRMLMGRSCY